MYKNFFIMDLDGCFSDDKWRFLEVDHSIENLDERYKWYNESGHADIPANIEIARWNMRIGRAPLVITARPEYLRLQTATWLQTHFKFMSVLSKNLLMRPDGNHDHSPKLKEMLLKEWLKTHNMAHISVAYDDRDDVLNMYRSLNIQAIRLQSSEYERRIA